MPEPIVTPDPVVTPAAPATPPAAPAAPADNSDPVKMAEELGRLKKVEEDYKEYRGKTDPVLETLWSDEELLAQATAVHNKRLGKAPVTPTPPADGAPAPQSDVRNSQISVLQGQFESQRGIDKLAPDKQAEVRGKIGAMLKTMLDPNDNKTIDQIFAEVNLVKLPWYMDRAYDLLTKDDQIAEAEQRGKNSVLADYGAGDPGMISSMPGGSVPIESVTLTPKEREVAKKQGISEEDYLKSKKEILQYKNS
jgi:hypothetical protein